MIFLTVEVEKKMRSVLGGWAAAQGENNLGGGVFVWLASKNRCHCVIAQKRSGQIKNVQDHRKSPGIERRQEEKKKVAWLLVNG